MDKATLKSVIVTIITLILVVSSSVSMTILSYASLANTPIHLSMAEIGIVVLCLSFPLTIGAALELIFFRAMKKIFHMVSFFFLGTIFYASTLFSLFYYPEQMENIINNQNYFPIIFIGLPSIVVLLLFVMFIIRNVRLSKEKLSISLMASGVILPGFGLFLSTILGTQILSVEQKEIFGAVFAVIGSILMVASSIITLIRNGDKESELETLPYFFFGLSFSLFYLRVFIGNYISGSPAAIKSFLFAIALISGYATYLVIFMIAFIRKRRSPKAVKAISK
ncbi:MAG: hypothetical protein II467_02575 [Bacilli bacterium]|nr:hypothetical protein [Bacilli bacterium]